MSSKAFGKQIFQTSWEKSFVKTPWSLNLFNSNYWQTHYINTFVSRYIGKNCSLKFNFFSSLLLMDEIINSNPSKKIENMFF